MDNVKPLFVVRHAFVDSRKDSTHVYHSIERAYDEMKRIHTPTLYGKIEVSVLTYRNQVMAWRAHAERLLTISFENSPTLREAMEGMTNRFAATKVKL